MRTDDDGPADRSPRVGVVGAGITGLALVHHLRERGVSAVCFEARDRPGGVVHSRVTDGRVLELGPQRTRLAEPIEDLVGDLSLYADLVVGDDDLPIYVYAGGRLREVPRDLGSLLRTDLVPPRALCRALTEPLTDPIDPSETAAEAFTRKFGPTVYENVIAPLFGGIYASDPAAMPARHALAGLMRLEEREGSLLKPALDRLLGLGDPTPPPISFDDGLGRLTDALYAAHADRIHLDTPVTAVRPADHGGGTAADGGTAVASHGSTDDAPRYVIETGDGRAIVDRVVVTTPQVRRDEPLATLGVTWNASLFDRDELYTVFLGGMDRPELADAVPDRLGALAREEFRTVMGREASVIDVTRLPVGFPAYDGSWDALDDLTLPPGVHLATNYVARSGLPGRVRQARRLAERFVEAG
ncbi:protoporphyrinogen oxidase [Halobacteriales archaeon SW_7_68_16]|nr:MAG: protoporphyrinogen oxidase [Halobacteriales archaeon SW_7_68_16]